MLLITSHCEEILLISVEIIFYVFFSKRQTGEFHVIYS
jgi:hypothetical protein